MTSGGNNFNDFPENQLCISLHLVERHCITVPFGGTAFPQKMFGERRFQRSPSTIPLPLVAIVNALQLKGRPTSSTSVPIRFNYDNHDKFEVAQPIRCRLIAFLLLNR